MYKLKLEINNKVYKTEGKTVYSCLNKLKELPHYKTMGFLYISNGKTVVSKHYKPFKMKRLFSGNKMIKLAMSKNLSILLGE
ncbi:MAG: hypothetical protein DRJ64_02665 [Thermoprotei archaeon]|nr:MAG: hypothetical protein DRJ64_02665 [Thermoprotei archaeon]